MPNRGFSDLAFDYNSVAAEPDNRLKPLRIAIMPKLKLYTANFSPMGVTA